MMRYLGLPVVGLALAAAVAATGWAHGLDELEGELQQQEPYFQPVDQPAPDFSLEDADGRAVSLEDFRGKVVVLHFIYTTCPDVCSRHADRIAEIQAMVNETPMRDRVAFISVTTDPEHDTPAMLRRYGRAHGLDPVNWAFLTSGPDEPEATRALAERFGHKFTKSGGGYRPQGVITHVIDREGNLRAEFHGLKFDPTNFVIYVNALVNDVHTAEAHDRSLWSRVLDLF